MKIHTLIYSFVCLLVGISIGIVAMQEGWRDWLIANMNLLLAVIVLGFIVLAVTGVLGYLILKWWVKRKLNIKGDLTGEDVVVGLADKLTNREEKAAPDAQDRLHSLMVNLGFYYVRSVAMQRYFLIIGGTFTALIGMVTVFLLNEQNRKLDIQTEQIRIQSQANTVASLLMEGTRRAALASEQTSLFHEIRAEATEIRGDVSGKPGRECGEYNSAIPRGFNRCWRRVQLPNGTNIALVHLSDDLFRRVQAYAQQATPYPIAVRIGVGKIDIQQPLDDQYEILELSPERGQLLQELTLSGVDANLITFEKAALQGLDLSDSYLHSVSIGTILLKGANLSAAVLADASLVGADFSGANMTGADLGGADISAANLSGTILVGTSLGFTNLEGTELREANFVGVNLGSVKGLGQARHGNKDWLIPFLARTRGLNEADFPVGYRVSCSVEIEAANTESEGDRCPAEKGWTILYEDQPILDFEADTGNASE